jgi:hypothetical protein
MLRLLKTVVVSDRWLEREFPTVEFERYADAAVVHCVTERQAREVLAALSARMVEVGLQLHPDKPEGRPEAGLVTILPRCHRPDLFLRPGGRPPDDAGTDAPPAPSGVKTLRSRARHRFSRGLSTRPLGGSPDWESRPRSRR